MEIKTTWDILEWFENKIYDIKKPKEYNNDKHKKWVSVDSLKKFISYQELDENGSLIKGLCKKDIDYILKELEKKDDTYNSRL